MSPITLRLKTIDGPSHFVIIISTKIDKRATKRNRMRRLIREALRHFIPTRFSVMCVVKKHIADYSYKEVETMVGGLLHEKIHS